MKTNIIQKNISNILTKYSRNNGCISIVDIYNRESISDIIGGKFTESVKSFCDYNCNNDPFSRWTNFGVDLVNDAIDFTKEISDLLITK